MTMLDRKFNRFMKQNLRNMRLIKRDMPKEKHTKDHLICCHCKRSSRTKYKCPKNNKKSTSRNFKKRRMMATWSDSDDAQDEEEDEITNLCFMAFDDYKTLDVISNSHQPIFDIESSLLGPL